MEQKHAAFRDVRLWGALQLKKSSVVSLVKPDLLHTFAPSPDMQRLLLFFDSTSENTNDTPLDFLQMERRFLSRFNNLPWDGEMLHQGTTEKEHLLGRLQSNINTAEHIIIDGYKGKTRRTGEKTFIHPFRVFLRGLSDIRSFGLSDLPVYYTSLLARMMHDAKEDFPGFYFEKKRSRQTTPTEYAVFFKKQSLLYSLYLTPAEKNLLELQIEALTIPPTVDVLPNDDRKTHLQINHLLRITEDIYKQFGPMAAYQTLRIKLDDRIDNMCTYFSPDGKSPRDRLFDKLKETILFFNEVEGQARIYYDEYREKINERTKQGLIPYLVTDEYESVVQFCYYLLLGGRYNEIFQQNIENARQQLKAVEYEGREIKQCIENQFFIPTLIPTIFRTI